MARFVRAALAVALVSASFSAFVAPASGASAAVTSGAAWLRTQQQPDGGFETEGFPGFENADAILALAQSAQSGASWDAAAARAAVLGTSTSGGATPLDSVDTYASGSIDSGEAGKVIVLVTNPLALDPAAFDPSGDGAVDLVAELGVPGPDDKWGLSLSTFNTILFAIRGYATIASVPTATITVVRNAQKSDGSWSYDGSSSGTDGGADTTGLAVQALLESGVAASDPDVDQALDYLEAQQQPDGAWTDGFSENPNSTTVAMLALSAAGRTSALAAGDAYVLGIQQPDGHFAGPYDDATPNTFGSAQSVQALVRTEIPDAESYVAPQTVPAAIGGGAVTLETERGLLENVTAVDPAALGAAPPGVTFPHGLVSFEISKLDDGETVTVRLTLPIGTTFARYFKVDGATWSDATSLAVFSGNVVTLTLTDGGAGDADGEANGVIVDPSGPAVVASAVSPDAIVIVPRFTG